MSALHNWWREERWLFVGLGLLMATYGVLAAQGGLPLLSPDETAVFTVAKSLWKEGRLGVYDPRAQTFLWVHPRSFTTQDGWLLPVGFPLWPFLLGIVGWIGSGGIILWLEVVVSASALIPLSRLAERCWSWSKRRAVLWAGTILLFPIAVLYGARSGFTLMPQLALVAWSGWLLLRGAKKHWHAVLIGGLIALAVGLRPTELVWTAPVLGVCWYGARESWKGYIRWVVLGVSVGIFLILGLHWWVYGAPWLVGYLLPSSSSMVRDVSLATAPSSFWSRFFPYGFSLSRLRQNGVAAWQFGFWPWVCVWGVTTVAWVRVYRSSHSRLVKAAFVTLCWTTVWLIFYYGQGQYADHIGGQAMHLGSSFLRYLAPAALGWMGWAGWVLLSLPRTSRARVVCTLPLLASIIAGVIWAYTDSEDGLLRGRRERRHYASVRAQMLGLSDERAVWISDRSDKMLFPVRMSVSPLPSRAEIRRFLQGNQGGVFLYARPPRQQERDRWSQEGLELIERAHFARETIYEVRLRPGFADLGGNQAH